MMKIKVCGMTERRQVEALEALGVDMAGFIFYEKSPRWVGQTGLKGEDLKDLHIKKVGVFVNANYEVILRTVDAFSLDLVQLHGRESPALCAQVKERVPVIKAFSSAELTEATVAGYRESCSYFLFDSAGARNDEYGGTGRKFNWSELDQVGKGMPFFLSGGLAPGDEDTILAFAKEESASDLFALDLNSRFEIAPGIKDLQAIETFTQNLSKQNTIQ